MEIVVQRKRFLNHDFLILELQPRNQDALALHIWVEKWLKATAPGIDKLARSSKVLFIHNGLSQRMEFLQTFTSTSIFLLHVNLFHEIAKINMWYLVTLSLEHLHQETVLSK